MKAQLLTCSSRNSLLKLRFNPQVFVLQGHSEARRAQCNLAHCSLKYSYAIARIKSVHWLFISHSSLWRLGLFFAALLYPWTSAERTCSSRNDTRGDDL